MDHYSKSHPLVSNAKKPHKKLCFLSFFQSLLRFDEKKKESFKTSPFFIKKPETALFSYLLLHTFCKKKQLLEAEN